MSNIDNMSNKTLVAEQYKNTENLTLRQGLHEKYSVNKIGLGRWMFEQYPFRAGIKVLELGKYRLHCRTERSCLKSILQKWNGAIMRTLWKSM